MGEYTDEELQEIASSICSTIEYRYDEVGEVDLFDILQDRRRWGVSASPGRVKKSLRWLEAEGFIFRPGGKYALTSKGRALIRARD